MFVHHRRSCCELIRSRTGCRSGTVPQPLHVCVSPKRKEHLQCICRGRRGFGITIAAGAMEWFSPAFPLVIIPLAPLIGSVIDSSEAWPTQPHPLIDGDILPTLVGLVMGRPPRRYRSD